MLYIQEFDIDSYCLVDENGCYIENPHWESDILTFDRYEEWEDVYAISESSWYSWSSWSIIDKESGYFIAFRAFDNVLWFHKGLGVAGKKKDEHWGFLYGLIDGKGRFLTPCQWDTIDFFWNGQGFDFLGKVEKNRKWGFLDREGREIIPCQYEDVSFFREGLAAVRTDRKWGYIDEAGNSVIPCIYDHAEPFCKGTAVVSLGKVFFEIDKTGRRVRDVPAQAQDPSSGVKLVPVDCDGKWGYADQNGNMVLDCRWEDAERFFEGLASVKQTGKKWGFIDEQGNLTIDCEWDDVLFFENGLCEVRRSGAGWGFIDRSGNLVYPCIGEDAEDIRLHMLCAERRNNEF